MQPRCAPSSDTELTYGGGVVRSKTSPMTTRRLIQRDRLTELDLVRDGHATCQSVQRRIGRYPLFGSWETLGLWPWIVTWWKRQGPAIYLFTLDMSPYRRLRRLPGPSMAQIGLRMAENGFQIGFRSKRSSMIKAVTSVCDLSLYLESLINRPIRDRS
jgi:hypothetical protein